MVTVFIFFKIAERVKIAIIKRMLSVRKRSKVEEMNIERKIKIKKKIE